MDEKYRIATVVGNYTALLPIMWEMEMTLEFTDTTGTQTLQIPQTSLLPVNKRLKCKFIGNNAPIILAYSTETLDGQVATGTPLGWSVPVNSYISSFKPRQYFEIVWDGANLILRGNN